MLRARRVRRPRPDGRGGVDHAALGEILVAVGARGVPGIDRDAVAAYRAELAGIDPDGLTRDEALAYWLNLYNVGALDLAARTAEAGEPTVLRTPGGFDRPFAVVAGERLSLHDVEHGKIRRFGDPRIHAALVCGSASCPTLRGEPYRGDRIDGQLHDQMTAFLASGGAVVADDRLALSRLFLWYGADFVRPHRMPALLPASRSSIAAALLPWLPDEVASPVRAGTVSIGFQSYDWGLACSVG
jgi:hypothetical protein